MCFHLQSLHKIFIQSLCTHGPSVLSQPLHSCVSVFLTLSPFNALFLIWHPPLFYFSVILLSLSASSISISSSHLFLFFSTFLSPFQVLFLLHFFCLYICIFSANIFLLICWPLSFPHLNSFCPLFSLSLPPPRFGPVLSYAICHFACCVNGFLFPHPTALSSLRSSIGLLLICVLCQKLHFSLSLPYFFFFSQWYYLGLPIPGWSALLFLPPPSFPHPLPVLIYSHAESRDRQIENQVWKEEVSGEVGMTLSDILLMLNWNWTNNQRVNRLPQK